MDPGILSRAVRVWTGITRRGQEAPKGRAISAASAEVLPEEIRRGLHRGAGPEAMPAYRLPGAVIKVDPALSAGRPQEAGFKEEEPGVEASEVPPEAGVLGDRPEAISAAADGAEGSDIS
jgi:hypothetical protein